MTVSFPERVPARGWTPTAAGWHAATGGIDCSPLHNAFGPGCPYCMTAAGSAVAQKVPFWLPGCAGGAS